MNRDQAVALVKQHLGFRTNLDSEIVTHLQNAQSDLELGITLPWFLLEEDVTISVTAGNRDYPLPDGFLRLHEDDPLHFIDENGSTRTLAKKPYAEALNYYSGFEPGNPQAYSIRKETFFISPEPSAAITITYSYFKAAPELTDGTTENDWLTYFPYLLIGEAGLRMSEGAQNPKAQKFFANMLARDRVRLSNVIAEREQQNTSYALGRNR